MSPSHKRRRTACCKPSPAAYVPPPSPPPQEWKVPLQMLLEIAARSDATTLVRLAAACKLLRGEILTLGFVSRVCTAPPGLVPTRLHSYLDKTFCLQDTPETKTSTRPSATAMATATATTPETKRRAVARDFVSRSSSWSWEALCTRRQDDDADKQDDCWRHALKTLYINSQIFI